MWPHTQHILVGKCGPYCPRD
uniref:Uncharacterized protein n=1 Tax=Anguilla anguilla TaxID=7936 RepID=A0A0E9TQ58_ANGAN